MIRLFRDNEDIHAWAMIQIGTTNRTFGKIGIFATLYGGSEMAIISQAPRFGMDTDEIRPHAKTIHAALPRMFPDFMKWSRKVEQLPRVPGLFGAILIPPPHPDESYVRREKVNCSIQRGAVDIVKLQTLALEEAGFRTVHQIHDEVILDVAEEDDTEDFQRSAIEVMEQAVTLDVPLKVETKLWGEK
jgi:DNA polymerase I-like protein with 3'-5' exonuclease and polymerase domains